MEPIKNEAGYEVLEEEVIDVLSYYIHFIIKYFYRLKSIKTVLWLYFKLLITHDTPFKTIQAVLLEAFSEYSLSCKLQIVQHWNVEIAGFLIGVYSEINVKDWDSFFYLLISWVSKI